MSRRLEVGDLVRQGDRVLEMKSGGRKRISSTTVGVVVEIRDQLPPRKEETEHLRAMIKMLGRQVDVLWATGKLSKNFAENSLDVIDENE